MQNKIDDLDFFEDKGDDAPEAPTVSTFNSNVLMRSINEFPACDLGGKLCIMTFVVEATEDYIAGTTFNLVRIPPSEVRILGSLSQINFSPEPFEGSFGWTKHRTRRREVIELDPTGFDDALMEPPYTVKVDSLEGFFMIFTAANGGKKGDKIEGFIIYVKM